MADVFMKHWGNRKHSGGKQCADWNI